MTSAASLAAVRYPRALNLRAFHRENAWATTPSLPQATTLPRATRIPLNIINILSRFDKWHEPITHYAVCRIRTLQGLAKNFCGRDNHNSFFYWTICDNLHKSGPHFPKLLARPCMSRLTALYPSSIFSDSLRLISTSTYL